MAPFQQRVVDEKNALDEKYNALTPFIGSSPIYAGLPAEEQERLTRQHRIMGEYSAVLGERIAAFT